MTTTQEEKQIKNKKTKDAFAWWKAKSKIQPGDSFGTRLSKIAVKIAGGLLLVIFSPLLLLAFIVTFLAAL